MLKFLPLLLGAFCLTAAQDSNISHAELIYEHEQYFSLPKPVLKVLEEQLAQHKPIYLIEEARTESPKLKLIEKRSKKVLDTIYLKYLSDE